MEIENLEKSEIQFEQQIKLMALEYEKSINQY